MRSSSIVDDSEDLGSSRNNCFNKQIVFLERD